MKRILFTGGLLLALLTTPAAAMDSAPAVDRAWRQELRQEAAAAGISEATLQQTLDQAQIVPKIYELLDKQPEFTLTYDQYTERVMPAARIAKAREKYAEHRQLLDKISATSGVDPHYIIALWAIESDFGAKTGDYLIVDALFTLSYNTRRAEFFRKELLKALRIVDEGHIRAGDMRGSWAGAMGQNQFMPSSFFNYAVDYDGDGHKDIWGNLPDVLASIANYLKTEGWQTGEPWGHAVRLPDNFATNLASRTNKQPVMTWRQMGVTLVDGSPLPMTPAKGAIILPVEGQPQPAFLVYKNFDVIMHWNKSTYFATTVGRLADKIIE